MIDAATQWDFRTPGGNPVRFHIRPGTSDWNTCNAITEVGNEYSLPRGNTGWMLDVGAHIGACIVSYLLDNPEARGIALEALPENVEYVSRNLEANGVADRAVVIHGAAAQGDGETKIGYSMDLHHRFIGNANAPAESEFLGVRNITLAGVLEEARVDEIEWTKIDCEGCEYGFLTSPSILGLKTITGEVHFGNQRLIDILSPTHDIQADKDFGPFWAVRR